MFWPSLRLCCATTFARARGYGQLRVRHEARCTRQSLHRADLAFEMLLVLLFASLFINDRYAGIEPQFLKRVTGGQRFALFGSVSGA
jgi:hypothetical protein